MIGISCRELENRIEEFVELDKVLSRCITKREELRKLNEELLKIEDLSTVMKSEEKPEYIKELINKIGLEETYIKESGINELTGKVTEKILITEKKIEDLLGK